MPIGTTSYFCLSMALSTEAAESRETSCSPLRPPKSIPTLSFFITKYSKGALSGQQSGILRGREHAHSPEAERGIAIGITILKGKEKRKGMRTGRFASEQ